MEHNERSEHNNIKVLQTSPHQFRAKPNKTLSANFTASGVYAPEQIRTEICNFGSLFQFSSEEDVDEVIAAANIDTLHHAENETMPKVAYHAGPGGGQGVILKLEPLPETVSLTWGMWHSVLAEITKYYDREGKMPIDFLITYIIESGALLIGAGSLVHDLWGKGDED